MTVLADVPTVGLYVGWVFGVIAAVILVIAAIAVIFAVKDRDGDAGWFAFWATLTAVILGGITLWAMWPLKYEYHHYLSKTGVVQTIDKRLVGVGGEDGASERYVIKPLGDPNFYGVDDTRAGALRPGDRFAIKCKKEHQFFQPYEQNGWACRWGA